MKTVKKVAKAFKQFDKLTKDLTLIQEAASNEMNVNQGKISKNIRRYQIVRDFMARMMAKLKARRDTKNKELNAENKEIRDEAKRALRVKERIEDLLK